MAKKKSQGPLWNLKFEPLLKLVCYRAATDKKISFEEAGRVTGLAPTTAKKYIAALDEEGFWSSFIAENGRDISNLYWILIATTYDPDSRYVAKDKKSVEKIYDDKCRYQDWIIWYIDSEANRLREAKKLKGVEVLTDEARIVLGADWDIVLPLFSISRNIAADFVTRVIRTCPFVATTRTITLQKFKRPKGGKIGAKE